MTQRDRALQSLGLLVLRLAVGAMMLTHGWPKLEKLLSAPDKFPDPIGVGPEISLVLAVFAEVPCAVLVALGLFTRWAALPLLVTMAVAAFIVHGDDPFNKQEMALLYGSGTLAIMLTGPGAFSIDAWRSNRRG